MKPSFYLAGKYSDREKLCAYASVLRANGFYVNAEWLEGQHEKRAVKAQQTYAQADLRDIRDSHRFIMVQNPESSSGRNVEFGYALAMNKLIYIIGEPSTVFHHLAAKCFASIEELMQFLTEGKFNDDNA